MARPLPLPDPHRSGTNGSPPGRPASAGPLHLHPATLDEAQASSDNELLAEDEQAPAENSADSRSSRGRSRTDSAAEAAELEHSRSENAQLRALCLELEQALQEAAQQIHPDLEKQIREYDAVLEEKNELIRQLHLQLQESQAILEDAGANAPQAPPARTQQEPTPCEDELLALSEELERERRQLQEDEQTLMEQMRVMEVSMARERAEMARQRNDLQRLQSEIRHDLERLERNGATQKKIEELKGKLQDVTARRGAAPASTRGNQPTPTATPIAIPPRKEGLIGRLFGRGGE
jgi:hypothetical protein